jgi:adenylate cyclase
MAEEPGGNETGRPNPDVRPGLMDAQPGAGGDVSAEASAIDTATFVFADLAGYTALTEAHGDEHAADTAAEFSQAVRNLIDDYSAEEVKTIGDAMLLRVPDAAQAVHLGARLVGDHGARHRSLGVRIGMHTGGAVRREGDWFGASVNVASRIADLAHAGEVLISAATKDAAGGVLLPGQLRRRGHHRLKNVAELVELFALVPEGVEERRLPIDPVCRMAVDPALATEQAVYRGVEHHFCSTGCAEAFRAAPERYAGRRSDRAVLLVSDQARERTARRVARAYTKGRIDGEELERRTELVWAARIRADLHAVTHDLPHPRRRVPVLLWPFWPAVLLVRRVRRRIRAQRSARRLRRRN